jgi:hypothetical protein
MTQAYNPSNSSSRMSLHRDTHARTPAQIASLVVGIVFLAVGILGFVPGITENLDDIKFASHESGAELLGVFQVSVLHNVVHLLFGVIGIAAASRHASSRSYLIAGGLVYLALWVYGLIVDHDSDANFVPLNDADNWLHLGLGAGMIVLGLALGRDQYDRLDDRRGETTRIR